MTLEGALQFLALLTEKIPPMTNMHHVLTVVDGEVCVTLTSQERTRERYFLDADDMKKDVAALLEEIVVYRTARLAEEAAKVPEKQEEVDPNLWHAAPDDG